jgi:hypothetical protein
MRQKISTHFDGGPSVICRTRSDDPHRRQQKLFTVIIIRHEKTSNLPQSDFLEFKISAIMSGLSWKVRFKGFKFQNNSFAWAPNSQQDYHSINNNKSEISYMTFMGFGKLFEGEFADICAGKFPLMLMGGPTEGLPCADPRAA